MDVDSQSLSSLVCEIAIIQAKNMEFLKLKHGNIFVRYYLSSRPKNKIQLSTEEIPLRHQSNHHNLVWNESFSLECLGTEDLINNLMKESVVFELRRRSTNPVIRKLCGGSQLVGRAEVPWIKAMESQRMEMEDWVFMGIEKTCVLDGFRHPSVQIRMRVIGRSMVVNTMEKNKRNGGLKRRVNECCCTESGCKCEDHDVFALIGAFEAL